MQKKASLLLISQTQQKYKHTEIANNRLNFELSATLYNMDRGGSRGRVQGVHYVVY